MSAGKYRHVIGFQWQVETRNADDLLEKDWQQAVTGGGYVLDAVRAEVLTGPGKQLMAAGVTHNEVSARINLHWFPELNATWRVIHDGTTYDIVSMSTDRTGRRELRLVCKAGVNSG